MQANTLALNPIPDKNALSTFNEDLEAKCKLHALNEHVLVSALNELDEIHPFHEELYWLTLARINELALICAGNYADCCELALAGDLLVNPRLILVHVRGKRFPVLKDRHMALTEQFKSVGETKGEIIDWLKRHALVEIKTEALLPQLFERLWRSGRISEWYLESISERGTRIADLSGLLGCGRFRDGTALIEWLRNAGEGERELLESKLCRFDPGLFFQLGQDIRILAEDPSYNSRFLNSVQLEEVFCANSPLNDDAVYIL
ncbi:MAG: hypothetical protein ACOWYE_11245 [Desulfatiglandales bacterium]